ncbi:alpha/beta fold hydrolase [Nannocystaceae bacterium ST9]
MRTTALLLPGLDGTGELFAGAIAPAELALTIVDYPREQPVARAALIERILAALPREGSVVLVGESFSGPLALEVAARVPRLVGVVLLASFAASPRARPLLRLLAWAMRWVLRRRPPRFIIRWFMTGRAPALIERVLAIVRMVGREVLADRLRQVAEVDAREALRTCPAPLLALVARDDRLVPRRAVSRLLALRPDLRVVTLPGPHLLFQHDPAAVLAAISAWLSERAVERAGEPVIEPASLSPAEASR